MSENAELRRLIAASGWTYQKVAAAVNAAGREAGLSLSYDRTAVAHWVEGTRPRVAVRGLLAEVFSRVLERPVPTAELGFEGRADRRDWLDSLDSHDSLAVGGPEDLELIASLTAAESLTHAAIGPFRAAGLEVPDPRRWPAAFRAGTGDTAVSRIGRSEVNAATSMLSFFSDADAAFGGGRALAALSGYLVTVVSGWLRQPSRIADHQALLSVAGSLCYLAGFACLDQRSQAAAQRYYLLSLRLMHEAGDTTGYGIVLRAMSVQARLLDRRAEAVALAEAATDAVGTRAPALTRAFLTGQSAVARAAADDAAGAARELLAASELLGRAAPEPVAIGRYDAAALAHAESVVAAAGGQRKAAIERLSTSLRHRHDTGRRSRAVLSAQLAEIQLADGQLDAALVSWRRFCDDVPALESGRVDAALASMRSRLLPLRRHPATADLLARAAVL